MSENIFFKVSVICFISAYTPHSCCPVFLNSYVRSPDAIWFVITSYSIHYTKLYDGGEYAIELSQESQDDLLAAALTSDWVAGSTVAGLSVTVSATGKIFTRASGDFTTDVEVGDLVRNNFV